MAGQTQGLRYLIRRSLLAALLVCAVLPGVGCAPPEPVRIGFLGGLTGRGADLGNAGRDGALLAVEDVNAAGGINGRPVELLIRDDEQKPEIALKALGDFKAAHISIVIGPMTSSIAETILPQLDASDLIAISPTVTASTLAGKDDRLFKVAPSVSENTRLLAIHAHSQGYRRIALAFDTANRAYSEDLARHFTQDFAALGGQVVVTASFHSGDDASYGNVFRQMIAGKPDALLLISNAVDTVRLIRIVRNTHATLPLLATSWAATEYLLQLGGRTVENVALTQFFNRDDQSPRYRAFATKFQERFKSPPGFASVAAYDATRAALLALAERQQSSLKAALLANHAYDGLQETWRFDANGDAQRPTYLTIVRDRRFQIQHESVARP